MKKNPCPTVAEQLERAKDGWFYEFWLERWIHVSEVETAEKARQLLVSCKKWTTKIKDWIRIHGINIARVGFVLIILSLCLPLLFGNVSSFAEYFMFFSEHAWATAVMCVGSVLIIGTIPLLYVCARGQMFNGVEDVYYDAIALKDGRFYDAEGNKHFFKGDPETVRTIEKREIHEAVIDGNMLKTENGKMKLATFQINRASLAGQVASEPKYELAEMDGEPTGHCSFSLAVTRREYGQEPVTEFFNIVAWGERAEAINKYFHMGNKIFVTGELHTRSYTDGIGVKHDTFEIVLNDFAFIEAPCANGEQQSDPTGDTETPLPPTPTKLPDPTEATDLLERYKY